MIAGITRVTGAGTPVEAGAMNAGRSQMSADRNHAMAAGMTESHIRAMEGEMIAARSLPVVVVMTEALTPVMVVGVTTVSPIRRTVAGMTASPTRATAVGTRVGRGAMSVGRSHAMVAGMTVSRTRVMEDETVADLARMIVGQGVTIGDVVRLRAVVGATSRSRTTNHTLANTNPPTLTSR